MLSIYKGSILDFEGDAIVNPANSFLNHSGGLARIIAKAAAPLADYPTLDAAYERSSITDLTVFEQDHDWAKEQAEYELIATGGAGITSAGRLPYKAIIHAVGPIWNGGSLYENELLCRVHEAAYVIASRLKYGSIAFPAISCGIFGFPVEKAAQHAVKTIRDCQAFYRPMDVTFALFEDAHVDAYTKALEA